MNETTRELLYTVLEVAVPMHIAELRQLPLDEVIAIGHDQADTIGAKGDVLQFGGKGCAGAFNALARGLAALSFCPGGMRFGPLRYESAHPDREAATP